MLLASTRERNIFGSIVMLRPLLEEGKRWHRLGLGEGELLLSRRRQMEKALYGGRSDGSSRSSCIGKISWGN